MESSIRCRNITLCVIVIVFSLGVRVLCANGKVSLSFIDTKALSHENLDKMFPKETPKAGITW